jgi:long-chain acyl-CoA synthetase
MFEIDNTTIALLSVLLILIIYLRLFSKPEPLVHPLLLGKQSEVSDIRKEGETGVYRSWATGQGTPVCSFIPAYKVKADGQLSVRPASTLKTVKDVVSGPRMGPRVDQRCIMDTPVSFPCPDASELRADK